jgi:hypothetical protein
MLDVYLLCLEKDSDRTCVALITVSFFWVGDRVGLGLPPDKEGEYVGI